MLVNETKQSSLKAEWVFKRLSEQDFNVTADDVYDVLLGNITKPQQFVSEVLSLGSDYEQELNAHDEA